MSESRTKPSLRISRIVYGRRAEGDKHAKAPPTDNAKQHAARKAFDPHAEAIRGLVKQVDLL